ncbi:hypothetical protein ABIC83_002627 [Roseateles asaccharophilus]|uniref:hypothetical protein n=1 Tax=Roseateles asaccharophilus TaxID=582607 RepID=UPI003838DDD2
MNKPASSTSTKPLAVPISPADSMADAVRALNGILKQLSGQEAMDALKAGDGSSRVDPKLWAPAWEGCRVFKDQWIVLLARQTRDEWRRDIANIIKEQPEFNRANMIARSLEARLRITLDFAFKYLAPRHLCLLGDVLMLALEDPDFTAAEVSRVIATAAARSPNGTDSMLAALVTGASGMWRHNPERVLIAGGKSF